MARYIIEGGVPLKGEVTLLGAKNVAFKIMIASLLCETPSVIKNIANNANVAWVSQTINQLGGKVETIDHHTKKISPEMLSQFAVMNQNEVTRASSMFLPVLLHRFGRAKAPLPSGDNIGRRPIDRHLKGLEAMGARIRRNGGFIEASVKERLIGVEYEFEKNTHTGTETLIIAAVLARGRTILKNSAEEPEVDDLINFLNKAGGKIERVEPRTIKIDGVESLLGVEYSIMPDQNEAVTFGCAALATGGRIRVLQAKETHLGSFIEKVREAGANVEIETDAITFSAAGKLNPTHVVTAIFPGFKTDWQPLWATVMTQANGESTIHETIFENRFSYVELLNKMGANITFFEPKVDNPEEIYNFNWQDSSADRPHAIKILGPTKLFGSNIKIPDIRAGATLVLAALTASGQSILEGIEHIERGYENLESRLSSLGAKIRKVVA